MRMDETRYFKPPEVPTQGEDLSVEERAILEGLLEERVSLVHQLDPKSEDFEAIIQQIELLPNKANSENVQYELDYTWKQEDINHVLDMYNERAGAISKEDSYGTGQFLPWFLGTSKRKRGELRAGVSTLVVAWMGDKVSKGEKIDMSFQDTLATWAQNIHMAKMDSVLSLLNKDKINPGILDGKLKSEIMASLSFYDNNGYYSNLFKSTALNKNSSFEEVSQAINSLIFFNRHGNNAGYEASGNYAHRALQEIYTKRDEYFFRTLISSALKRPLEDRDIGYKKAILLGDGYDVRGMSDADIINAFKDFTENNLTYCRWLERAGYAQKISKPLGKSYGFGTYQEGISSLGEGFIPYGGMARQKRKKLESSVFADISPKYGVLHVSDNSFKIFEKDPVYELKTQQWKEQFGTLEPDQLQHNIAMLSRCRNKKDFPGMLQHLYSIGFLPEKKRVEILNVLGIIPDELILHDYLDFGEREEFIKTHQDELAPITDQLKKGGADVLITLLEESKNGIEEEAKKEYFGYKDINPDRIDFFLSFYENSPFRTSPPHHTIYYYAYIRKTLPNDLVLEFEKRAGIRFPKEIEAIETYDDFLSIKDDVLHASFANLLQDKENITWLHDQLVILGNNIKTKLPELKFKSLKEFMEDAAIPEEKITDQFLANYAALLDIKIRANVESKIGFSLADLDVPAQIAFLDFLSRTSEDEMDNFSHFLNKYEQEDRVAICSCYLAFEKEKDFSYMVERLCDHEGIGLPLARYVSKLIGNAQDIKGFLEKEFKTNYEKKNISHIHEKLIKRAYDLFLKYNRKVASLETIQEIEYGQSYLDDMDDDFAEEFGFDKSGTAFEEHSNPAESQDGSVWVDTRSFSGKNTATRVSYKEARDQIAKEVEEDCSTELVSQTLFTSSFKTLHEAGVHISLEDIESSDFTQVIGGAIDQEDIATMRSIYSHNQKGSAVHDVLLENFNERVINPSAKFYIFKWQGKIKGFIAFEPSKKQSQAVEATSFNVDPSAMGFKIGEAMIENTLATESENNLIVGETYFSNPILAKYLKKNAIVRSAFSAKGGLGAKIEWSKGNYEYVAKKLSLEELRALNTDTLHIVETENVETLTFPEGMVLTLIIPNDSVTGKTAYVFEKETLGSIEKIKE